MIKKLKISEKLVARLNAEFNLNIPDNEKPRRLYTGYQQKSIGAWSWCIGGNDNFLPSYGSSTAMTELLKHPYLILFKEHGFDTSILPVSKDEYDKHLKDKL